MRFAFSDADARFREDVRSFIRENLPEDIRARGQHNFHVDKTHTRRWMKILSEKGWSAPGWPRDKGGTGWSLMQQFIFDEENFAAGAPLLDTSGLKMIGPVIFTFGTDEQHERFNGAFLRGELTWGQGFSEPNAGSDLASLTTRAERDGDEYVINGHKIWTSGGHFANWLFVLVKTDPTQKQRGISLVLIPVDAPGVTIRPIIDIGEGHSLNEIFLEDVRIPVANLVGEENKGWTYAKFLLERERGFSAEVPRNKRNLTLLRRMARETLVRGIPLIEDQAFSARVEQLQSDLDSLEWMTMRALAMQQAGDTALPVGSILKVRGTELQQKIGEMQVEVLGERASYFHADPGTSGSMPDWPPGPEFAPGILSDYFYRRAVTIYGGSNEIQRTILAKQYLEL